MKHALPRPRSCDDGVHMSLAKDWPLILVAVATVSVILVAQVLRSGSMDPPQRRRALLMVGGLAFVTAAWLVIFVGAADTPGVSIALAVVSGALCAWLGWKGSKGWWLLGLFFVASAVVVAVGGW